MAIQTGAPLALALDAHRRELTGYCYRMLGSGFEAEDAVQETMMRALRAHDSLAAPEALRSWLYRIATNVCLDMLKASQRRARPMDLDGPGAPEIANLGPQHAEHLWVLPIQDEHVLPPDADPAEIAALRETIRLAFVAALQHLPAKQRAVLILREVLRWQATEVAALLDTSVASVNSALQRARTTLDSLDLEPSGPAGLDESEQQELLARYVDAFERYDMDELVALLHEDVTWSMPPYALWLRGREAARTWMLGPGEGCRGSRVIVTRANGQPAYAQYRQTRPGLHEPWGLALVDMSGGVITGVHTFLGPDLFTAFGLPARLEG